MPKYLYAYHGGSQPSTPEEGEKVMKAWMDWIGGMGEAMVDAGNPTGPSKTLAPGGKLSEGGGTAAVTGYSIVDAKSLDEAVRMARDCPQLLAQGSIEIAEIVPAM